jgi:ribosomal protein L35AE/L33A
MPILQIEHRVRDFDAWKRAFDSDPVGRDERGVLRYRISRATDDPNLVLVDLEFDTSEEAQVFQAGLRDLWSRVEQEGLIEPPRARIVEEVESKGY